MPGPPAVDFYSQLSGLGDTLQANAVLRQKQQINGARQEAFSNFTALDPNSPEYGKQAITIAQKLGSVGDQDGALKFLTVAQSAAERARQAQRDTVTDSHWNQSFELQKRAANRADEDKFVIKEVTDPNTGATTLVRVKTTGGEGPISTGLTPSAPNNPFSDGGKFNEGQGKAAGFTDRMLQSESILHGANGVAGIEGQGANLTQANLSKIPVAGNYLISAERQKYEQAKRDFINSQLRRESGAAISPSEFESADKQYFPAPGDNAETIKQKAANRRAAVEAMGRDAGGSYRPKSIYTQDGRLVALPKVGEMKDGYRFKGGDPADPKSWAKSQ